MEIRNSKTNTTTLDRCRQQSALKRHSGIFKAIATAIIDPFNADDVVEKPSVVISRELAKGDCIDATIYAQQVDGKWLASIEWLLTVEPFDGRSKLPCRKSVRHATKVDAVDAAFKLLFQQLENQLGAGILEAKWVSQIASLRKWDAKVHAELTKADQKLPLTGITTIEAFAGTGVASLAFKSQGATPLLVIEKDEPALAVCQGNLEPQHVHRDILDFDGKGWKCDVLLVGAVCTAHSKAGNGQGLKDSYVGPVHQAAMKMVSDVDFKVAIVECAPELLEPRFKADLAEWRMAFMRRGCDVQFRVMDAADFNLPQSRRRTIMIATRGNVNVDDIVGVMFPKTLPHTTTVEDILQPHVADHQHLGRIAFSEVVWKTKFRKSHRGLKLIGCIGGKTSQGYRVYDPKAPVGPTILATSGGRARCTNAYLIDGKVRGLTPREACRMQGLPEWFEHDAHTGRALKQAGNALAYPLFQAIGTQLASVLKPGT